METLQRQRDGRDRGGGSKDRDAGQGGGARGQAASVGRPHGLLEPDILDITLIQKVELCPESPRKRLGAWLGGELRP